MNKQSILAAIIALMVGAAGGTGIATLAESPSAPLVAESQALAAATWSMVCDGVVICQPFTPAPSGTPSSTVSATPSRTPTTTATPRSPTPTQVTPALPTWTLTPTATPLEVTPLGGSRTPAAVYEDRKAEIEYTPVMTIFIRRAPIKANNWTGVYAVAGKPYMIYHVRYYFADGSSWACMDDIAPNSCQRWFAIKADLDPVDGKLEEYSKSAEADG